MIFIYKLLKKKMASLTLKGKFRNVWILHPQVSKFGFYPLKFGGVRDFTP